MHFPNSLSSDSLISARAPDRSASSFISPDSTTGGDSFASVLSQVNEPSNQKDSSSNSSDDDEEDSDEEKKKKDAANRGPTTDQIAAALALTQTSLNGGAASPASPQNSRSGDGTTLNLVDSQGRSISQLLAEGKPVLEFQATHNQTADSETGAKNSASAQDASSEVAGAPKDGAAKTPSELAEAISTKNKDHLANASVEPKASALPAAAASAPAPLKKSGALNTSVGPAGVTSPAALAALKGQENFADQSNQQKGSGDNASDQAGKNASLVTDAKAVKGTKAETGTIAAIGGKPMLHDVRTTVSAALPADPTSGVSGSASSTTTGAASQADPARSAASHAADLVHQIHEIGEGLWSVDRQSVEVNFNFGEKQHLSVRVQYKDGQVQATFNTDSADLRAAISHAWNSQNSSADSRSFKMADPVFTGSSSNFSSTGDRSKQSSTPPAASIASLSSRSSASATANAPVVPSRANLRPEVAGRLNVIV